MSPPPAILKPVLSLIHYSGAGRLLAPWTRGEGIIFTLHHVLPRAPGAFAPNRILTITPAFLNAVVVAVRQAGYEFISMDDVHARLAGTRISERPFASFTFDDGYRDNLEHAYPVLKRHGVPFTIYVATDYADGKGELWWLVLEEVIRRSERIRVQLDGRVIELDCRRMAEKWQCFDRVYWMLRHVPECEGRDVVRRLAVDAGIDIAALCRELVMNWDELRAFSKDPLVTIGAHTRRHFALARLAEDDARAEMVGSARRIEHELGRPCVHFSFPYGDAQSAGEREFNLARNLGFQTAVTTRKGVVDGRHSGRLHGLSRVSLNGEYQRLSYVTALLSGLPFALLKGADRIGQAFLPGRPPVSPAAAPSTR